MHEQSNTSPLCIEIKLLYFAIWVLSQPGTARGDDSLPNARANSEFRTLHRYAFCQEYYYVHCRSNAPASNTSKQSSNWRYCSLLSRSLQVWKVVPTLEGFRVSRGSVIYMLTS
jgi:hypothetical protein